MQCAVAHLKRGNDMKPLIKFIKDPVERLGEAPKVTDTDKKYVVLFEQWKIKNKRHNERIDLMEENMEKLYGVIVG
eukprot:12045723-Ditylum_brightwellii.AAC.1